MSIERVIIYLPSNLYYLRKVKKIKQKDLAEKMGIKPQTLSGWETAYRRPDFIEVAKLAKIFDISTDDLLKKDLRKGEKYTKEETKEKITSIVNNSDLEEDKKNMINTMVNMVCEVKEDV